MKSVIFIPEIQKSLHLGGGGGGGDGGHCDVVPACSHRAD